MFKKKQTGLKSQKLVVDDSLVGNDEIGLPEMLEESFRPTQTKTEIIQEQDNRQASLEDRKLIAQQAQENTYMHIGSADSYERQENQTSILKLKNKQRGVANVFSVKNHSKGLVIDESRLLVYDDENQRSSPIQDTQIGNSMMEEESKLTNNSVIDNAEQRPTINQNNNPEVDKLESGNFRVSTSRQDSYTTSNLPLRYKALEAVDKQTREAIKDPSSMRSKAELAAFYTSQQVLQEGDDDITYGTERSIAERMQEEFRSRKLEQELQNHKLSSMSKSLRYLVHRGADDITTADVSDIKIAMTAKAYSKCDADVLEEIGENPKDLEEFEMYEKFILQQAMKNSRKCS
jgi:hypothetical protein